MLKMEPFVKEGQLVHNDMTTQYYADFLETARGLKNKGDIAEKFPVEQGTIIMIRLDDLKASVTEYDSVKEDIEEEVLTDKKNVLYSAAMEEWKELVKPVINTQYMKYFGMSFETEPTIDPNIGC